MNNLKSKGVLPKIATGVPGRVNRLQAIGNGQVPICVAYAFAILSGDFRDA
jgi:hypothetical protein